MALTSLRANQFKSPPRRAQSNLQPSSSSSPDLQNAQAKEKKSGRWVATAAGLTLAAGALAGCGGQPVPPAPDPGAYQLESPEVVVLSDSIQRIDLARETEQDCTGIGEDETCTTVDVAYHDIGIHMGEGIVQDLNGNLFAAPQLVADGAPGLAVSNPDFVLADGPLGTEGRLEKTGANTYQTRYSIFGNHTIRLSPNEAVVTNPGLFGGEYEEMRVTTSGGRAVISEGRWDQQYVQSQGDHMLVQSPHGRRIAHLQHNGNQFSLIKEQLFGDYKLTVSYNDNSVTRGVEGSWSNDTVVRRGQDEQGRETFRTSQGRWSGSTVIVTQDGWINHSPGLFGGSNIPYTVRGGETLPGQ